MQLTVANPRYTLFFGEIHCQSSLCDGTNSPAELYRYARSTAGLDFAAVTSHDFELTSDDWQEIRTATRDAHSPGKFVTFLGVEWSGQSAAGGDNNIYFLDDDGPLVNVLAVRDEMLSLADEHGLDGLAVQTFTSLVDAMGTYCSFAMSMVSESCPVGCESDVHGTLSAILLERASFAGERPFVVDFTVRHPENDNGVLLWHAGAPVSMCHADDRVKLGHHWILPSPLAGMTHFRLKDGPVTVARFDGDGGAYRLAIGEGRSTDGPATLNNYVWMEVNDWPKWERTLIGGPYIHHVAMIYDHCGDALIEAAKYVPGLAVDVLGREDDAHD